ncbi:enoyl-CoA hydratase/isomerase family protein [Nocardia sp. NPDC046473]|uniref:enoyl-CoA hydratase/isomerase family protein n=1 Tax=Nocardia sp. NPDC046473 TaxID=3155733 RepID=UPI0033DA1223
MDQEFRAGDVAISVDGLVVTAMLDRPNAKNSINEGILIGLEAATRTAEEIGARVLVIRGAGGNFCTGADLVEADRIRRDRSMLEEFSNRFCRILDDIETGRFVSIAVIEGFAVAGGCELLLACDIVIAESSALIGDGHMNFGLVPAAGGSVRLPRHLPQARANYLLLVGGLLTGTQAADWGLVTFVTERANLTAMVEGIASQTAARSSYALATMKKMIESTRQSFPVDAQKFERERFVDHMQTRDVEEGLSAFREKRLPVFKPFDESDG